MNEETLNSYIESSKTVDSSVIYQVALICGAFLILVLITGLIVLFMLKKKRIREMEEVRNDKDYNSMTELERMEFKKNCINPAEQPEAVIGSRGLKQYLTKEDEIDGFSVVTNRRVYFKGKLFVRDEKGGIIPYDGEHTYDNYEIKRVEQITERPVWLMVVSILLCVVQIGYIAFLLISMLFGKI